MPQTNSNRLKTFDDILSRYVPDRQPGQCWLWVGGTSKGYGHCGWRGKTYYAHRLIYEILVGPIPKGLHLDHLCRTPLCTNPAHLEPVTHGENLRRGRSYWREKMHCPQGHSYDVANTSIDKKGHRYCRECNRQRHRIRRHWQGGVWNQNKTHCLRGHAFDAANTRINKEGHRHCRECDRLMALIRYAKRKRSA